MFRERRNDMEERTFRRTRFAGLLAAVAIIAAACSSGGASGSPAGSAGASAPPATSAEPGASASAGASGAAGGFACENIGGEVSVYGTWTGAEQDSFLAMVAPWEQCSGAKINYTGQRDLGTALTAGIAGGNLPDLAGLPGPGLMTQWYEEGALKALDFVDFATYESSTPAGFAALGKAPDGKLTGIFTKGAVKGLIWYNTKNWTGTPPATWDELNTTARAAATGDTKEWCIGLEAGGDSGWPGTDWIEDIILRQAGPTVYDGWVAGTTKWSDPAVKAAWTTFGDAVANAYNTPAGYVNATNFGKAANPMFADPAGCLLHHQASFITDFFKNEAKAQPADYGFFPFPDIDPAFAGSITGGGDLFGMFNDTPQARSLIQYMLTPEAQQIWVERGGFISANKGVSLDAYPDPASKASAEILANAKSFRFDGSDLMPNAMNKAFFQGIVEYVQSPGNLDSILANLDTVQADAYTP
jgi:alpha-glucoside transport system substrate-binding protein